jgi:DNA-binding transcriptional regulator YiaG
MTPTALRRLRRRLDLTQGALAARVGVTSNTVARWERGELGLSGPASRLLALLAQEAAGQKGRKQKGTS